MEHPGFESYRKKLRDMDLSQISSYFPPDGLGARIRLHLYERLLWTFLVVISTNLTSMEVTHPSDLLEDVADNFTGTQHARGFADDHATLGRTGMHSLKTLVYRLAGDGPHRTLPRGLCLGLPRLRRLTVYNISSWLDGRFTKGTSLVEEIRLIECLPDEVLCAPVGSQGRCLLAVCPALKKLHVTRTGPLEWEFLTGRFGSTLARELNHLPALEEICFTTAQPPSELYPSGEAITPQNYNGLCSKAAVGRLGSIKNLFNLKKLTLPMAACVGRDLDNGYPKDYPRDESPGAHQNFVGFLQHSLPDDVSQLEMTIISPKTRLSAEDDVLLSSASFKKFKSFTILNRTHESSISSLDQVTSVQNAEEASLLAM